MKITIYSFFLFLSSLVLCSASNSQEKENGGEEGSQPSVAIYRTDIPIYDITNGLENDISTMNTSEEEEIQSPVDGNVANIMELEYHIPVNLISTDLSMKGVLKDIFCCFFKRKR